MWCALFEMDVGFGGRVIQTVTGVGLSGKWTLVIKCKQSTASSDRNYLGP